MHAGVVTHADLRDNYNPGNKYSQWELKGICVRLELGPKDMQKESVMSVRRDNGAKEAIPWDKLTNRMPEILEEMQEAMYKRAKDKVTASMATVCSFTIGPSIAETKSQSRARLICLCHNQSKGIWYHNLARALYLIPCNCN